MTYIIGVVSQKGGVGKSTISRLLAREFVAGGWKAKIADLDSGQSTSYNWLTRRNRAGFEPFVPVQQFRRVQQALAESPGLDVLILDGLPHASAMTREIAECSDLVIIPTGASIDDRDPGEALAKELTRHGVLKERIMFAFCRVPAKAAATLAEAYFDLTDKGFTVLEGAIPEQAAFIKANSEGRALTETPFSTLNEQASQVAQGVVDCLKRLNAEAVQTVEAQQTGVA